MTFHQFIEMQMAEIQRHKWIESEKAGHDLGLVAEIDWAMRYATQFRRYITDELGERIEYPPHQRRCG
jgi:hypothetical protein